MKIYGQWHGGSSYAHSGIEDREVFTSIAAAIQALRDRRDLGHRFEQTFHKVNGQTDHALTPAVDDTSYLDLYATPDSDDIWRRIEFGPHGGIQQVNA